MINIKPINLFFLLIALYNPMYMDSRQPENAVNEFEIHRHTAYFELNTGIKVSTPIFFAKKPNAIVNVMLRKLGIPLTPLDKQGVIGFCSFPRAPFRYILIDEKFYYGASEYEKRALIIHELAHCELCTVHTTYGGIMSPYIPTNLNELHFALFFHFTLETDKKSINKNCKKIYSF